MKPIIQKLLNLIFLYKKLKKFQSILIFLFFLEKIPDLPLSELSDDDEIIDLETLEYDNEILTFY